MDEFVRHLPIGTTVLSAYFAWEMLKRYREKRCSEPSGALHLAWWTAGIVLFGVGTALEGFTAVFGWHEWGFRSWYIAGAFLGGAPLAQGTVYLLLPRRLAHRMTIGLLFYIASASVAVLMTPVDASLAAEHVLNGKVIEWQWVRGLSPFINTYAFIFLVGGAIYSAVHFRDDRARAQGAALIAVGAILPGIGGSFSRAGYTEVLHVMEFAGIILIYVGYRLSLAERSGSTEPEAASGMRDAASASTS